MNMDLFKRRTRIVAKDGEVYWKKPFICLAGRSGLHHCAGERSGKRAFGQ